TWLAALDVRATDQHPGAPGQLQTANDPLSVVQRLVARHAPAQASAPEIGEQPGNAVEGARPHGAVAVVLLVVADAHGREFAMLGTQVEGTAGHGAGPARYLVGDPLRLQGGQAARLARGLAYGDEDRRAVDQRAVHVEQDRAQPHRLTPRAGSGSCS